MDVVTLPQACVDTVQRPDFAPRSTVSGVQSLPLPGVASRAQRGRASIAPAVPRNFIVGPENRLVLAVTRAVLAGDRCYNPIVFWGASGTGKSHLAHGLANALARHEGPAAVRIVSAADFAHPADAEESEHSQLDQTGAPELLVIEDLQHIAGKPRAQQRLAYAIDEMLGRDAQVMVTSGVDPIAPQRLTPRLAGRLAAGLLVPLHRPGADARLALVKAYAIAQGIVLPPAAAKQLASMPATAPQLQGALIRLESIARQRSAVIDEDLVAAFLAHAEKPRTSDLRAIATQAANYYEVKLSDLSSPSRRKAAVAARSLAIYIARRRTRYSLERIGEFFGGRDHSTVLHSLQKIERLVATDAATAAAVAAIQRALKED